MSEKPDLTNLPWFLTHLEERDAGLAGFARQLLDAGWEVQMFWGPVQMDVSRLRLRRRGLSVIFGIERGFVDGVAVGPGDQVDEASFTPLSYAVLGWARASGLDLPFDDPDEFPDVGRHGLQALDWLEAGNDDTLARIRAARHEYLTRRHSKDRRLGADWLAETKARGLRDIEAAAAPRDE